MTDLRQAAQAALENLEAVLCDPEGRACIHGSDGDLKIIDEALDGLRVALAAQQAECKPYGDLRNAKWLDPECYGAGACQSLKFKATPPAARPAAWREMIEDTKEVFDYNGSETPQIVRDVIQYVESWLRVAEDKAAQPQQATEARESLGWSAADESSFKEQR